MASTLCRPGKKKLLLVVAATVLILQHGPLTDGAGAPPANISLAKPGCRDKCGNVSVPYPFGIGDGCFLNEGFEIICDTGDQAYVRACRARANQSLNSMSPMKILEINLTRGEARVQSPVARYCNYTNGSSELYPDDYKNTSIELFKVGPPFRISETQNKFTAMGCATFVYIDDYVKYHVSSGCGSFCGNKESIDNNTQCSGNGCCQTNIPEQQGTFYLSFLYNRYNIEVWDFSPCSYGFIVDQDWFKFDPSYAKFSYFKERYPDGVPVVLEWIVDNGTCAEAAANQSSYACRDMNSVCIDMLSSGSPGYYCICRQGYDGSPYLDGSCQDINECDSPSLYPCHGKCKNTIGSYTCSCPPGTQSKDPKSEPCNPNSKIFIGIAASIIFIILCIFIVLAGCQKMKLAKEKERFFKQNGGKILYQQILSRQVDTVILFTIEDLKKATNNFDKSRELGIGGHGTVYKGILRDNMVVAVKRSKIINVTHTKEFVQEIIILSQINHRNVVRLLGCCLEVEVPILVYEFIPNGTLSQLIHRNNGLPPISLEARLRIAQESAEALAYLHLSTNRPIVHGDVKSLNILLDENYMVKVTDFGASRILPKDAVQHMTMVQGTLGYLDPEYLQERKLTEKSDVYSFGVVLLELITRKKAIYLEGPGEERDLASSFLQALKENRVEAMLDTSIMVVGMEELFQEVVELASLCLSSKGVERPPMTQVADKLKAIRSAWREILLLQHEESKNRVERLGVGSTCGMSPSMYWTAQMMGMDIETPRVDIVGTRNMG